MISILLIFVLIEGVANAFFFAQGSDSGLLGGFIQAVLFASGNVVIAALQGRYTLPFIIHRNIFCKCLGILALFISLSIVFAFALMISHYRDAMTLDVEEPARYALNTLKNTPFDLADINSYLLAIITIVFGILSLFDGFKLNDPYPFYGKKSKEFEKIKDEYNDELDEVRIELEEEKEEALKKLDGLINSLKTNLTQQDKIIEDKEHTDSTYVNYMNNAQFTLNALIQTFRTENGLHRTDEPPLYFKNEVLLQEMNLKEYVDLKEDRTKYQINKSKIDQLIEEVALLKMEVLQSFTEQYDTFVPLHHLMTRIIDMARRKRKNKEIKYILGVVLLILFFLAIVGGGTYYYFNSKEEYNKNTLCPLSGPESHTVLLIDKTDPLNFVQKQAFEVQLEKIINTEIPKNGLVSVFALGDNFSENEKPIIQVCNPGDGRDKSEWTSNLKKLKQRYNEQFVKPIVNLSNELTMSATGKYSPIFEQIQLVAINAFQKEHTAGEQTLIIFSDMLHNSTDYSMYHNNINYDDFAKSIYAQRVKADLSNVNVELYYIMNNPKLQTRKHLYFWEQYFNHLGARVKFVYPLEG